MPGDQGAASSGPGTGTQYQDPVTPPEAAWEPIVRPSLTGHVGRVGAGVYNRTHICFAMPHGSCVDLSDLCPCDYQLNPLEPSLQIFTCVMEDAIAA